VQLLTTGFDADVESASTGDTSIVANGSIFLEASEDHGGEIEFFAHGSGL